MMLPEASFAEIEAFLRGYCDETRAAANVAEVWAAKVGSPSLKGTTNLLDRDAATAGQLFALFRDLAPHEQLVRDFLAGLEVVDGRDKPGHDDRRAA